MKVWKQLRKICKAKNRGKYEGICSAIENRILHDKAVYVLWADNKEHAFRAWQKFSGNVNYPVPLGKKDPETVYYNKVFMWEGKYGKLRKELLEHLIQYYKERDL